MLFLLHTIFTGLFAVAVRILALWNPKARLWIKGRQGLIEKVESALGKNHRKVIWMHSASLGEFEQGRFLLETIRTKYPGYCLVVTFFSPSGYEVMKNYGGADFIFYLPLPSRSNAKRFISALNPSLVLWIKYDYWYHFLFELHKRNIPVLLVSAIFRKKAIFFRWYGKLYSRILHFFTWLFVQDPDSEKRLNQFGLRNVTISGDTRFDRVVDIATNLVEVPYISQFTGGRAVIVAGSTWPEDEEELDHFANTNPDIKFIVAPHEIHEEHIADIEKLFQHSVRYSVLEASQETPPEANTLIIDNIGMLSRLYRYATIAYVGGGFGEDGVHNVLEAAVYGKPVVFGPVFNSFREAIDLLEEGAAFTIDNAIDLEKTLTLLLQDKTLYSECSEAAKEYVQRNKGATERIIHYIQEKRLLIN